MVELRMPFQFSWDHLHVTYVGLRTTLDAPTNMYVEWNWEWDSYCRYTCLHTPCFGIRRVLFSQLSCLPLSSGNCQDASGSQAVGSPDEGEAGS